MCGVAVFELLKMLFWNWCFFVYNGGRQLKLDSFFNIM